MALALRRSRNCASMKLRCGSHADTEPAVAAVAAGGRGGGNCAPAPVATPGGFRRRGRDALLVVADRLAIDPRDALDLSLAGAGVQQGPDGRLQVSGFKTFTPLPPPDERAESNVLSGPGHRRTRRRRASRSGGQGGGIYVAISGGVRVAAGGG